MICIVIRGGGSRTAKALACSKTNRPLPPFLIAWDVMVVRAGHSGAHNMVAIWHVQAKNPQQPPIENNCIILKENKNLVGKVDVSHLVQRPGSFKCEDSLYTNATLCWHFLIQRMTDMKAIKVCGSIHVEWQKRAQWRWVEGLPVFVRLRPPLKMLNQRQ